MTASAHQYIQTQQALQIYCDQLQHTTNIKWIAVDTEFVRVDTYYPQLSLIQIEDNLGQSVLIDPLAIQENDKDSRLDALVPVWQSTKILKIFHSARQDLEVLFQRFGCLPTPIFDTQIAAIFLKQGEIAGYARLLDALLNIRINKSETRTDWHARPLSAAQVEYALDDVRYLGPLYQHCLNNLTDKQLSAVTEECFKLLNTSLYQTDPQAAWLKIKGTKGFSPKQLAIVRVLAEWREIYAIEHNRPKKWTLSDDCLLNIAKRPPKTTQALYKVPNIKASSVKEFGDDWIALIDDVFTQAPENWPTKAPKPLKADAHQEVSLQLCLAYAQQIAVEYKLHQSSLFQRSELVQLIQTPQTPVWNGWRQCLFGETMQQILLGQASLNLKNNHLLVKYDR
ncbi:HRDC domain-containing protein [Thiomicrorhabdus sp.]|uniref:ribonuclease D n=1 Tax=Thiomicrorhabdus sp. TaxID=2039724 RepID=UPI0029C73D9C|nr:HRDC domain-containing protein [Thiomicrorhabdus sp.]